MEKEIRYFENPVTIEDREGGDSRGITGYAAVFDKLSQDLGWFQERIDPAAFDKCDMKDVIACRNHDPDKVMARTTAETLNLEIDKKGLKYSFDAPDTTAGNDTLKDIQLKNISASSFAFTVQKDMWEEGRDGKPDLRTILEFKKLYDVAPVTNPAYLQTSVDANGFVKRSHDEWKARDADNKMTAVCKSCAYEFNYLDEDEAGMGYVRCPECGESVTQSDIRKKEIPPDTLSVREAEQTLIEIN